MQGTRPPAAPFSSLGHGEHRLGAEDPCPPTDREHVLAAGLVQAPAQVAVVAVGLVAQDGRHGDRKAQGLLD